MALACAGVKKSQTEIAENVYHSWWGTTQQSMLAYLSQYFENLNFLENAEISDIEAHLNKSHIVIVNWWDDLDPKDAEGHYGIAVDYDGKNNKITLADPSEGRGIWEINIKEFEEKWFDFLDVDKKIKIKRWMLWIDPVSKK